MTRRQSRRQALHRAVAPDSVESSPADPQRQLLEGDELFRSLATNVDLVLWLRAHDTDQISTSARPTRRYGARHVRASIAHLTCSQTRSILTTVNVSCAKWRRTDRVGSMVSIASSTPGGSIRWIHARTFAVSGRDAGTARVAGVAQDITEQKAAEEALRITLTRMRERYLFSGLVAAARTAEDVVNAVRSLAPLQHASRLTVLVFDEPWEDVLPSRLEVLVDWRGEAGLPTVPGESGVFAEHPFAHLFSRDGAVLISDVQTDPRLTEDARSWLAQANTRSLLLFPLVTSSQWYGVLNAHYIGSSADGAARP